MKFIFAIAAAALIAAPGCSRSNLRTVQCTYPDNSSASYTFDREGQTYDYDRLTESWVVTPANFEEFGDRWETRSTIVGNTYRIQYTAVSISDPFDTHKSFTEIDLKKLTIKTEIDVQGTEFDSVGHGTCKWESV